MRALILFASLTLVSSMALAEGHRGGEGKRGPNLKRMQQHLELSDEQVEQIREIRQNGGTRQDIRAVLTDEQIQKMEEHRARRKAHGGPPPGAGQRDEEPAEEG